ncbi:MAG: hypothetical protein P4L22_00590 [Candidatus Babeliales bacterium]|nr:hypothetical protein [Candidatus Babeliales bacterium]
MKINKLFLLLICLFNLQICGYPRYFAKFRTPNNKEIIILGDVHSPDESDDAHITNLMKFIKNNELNDKKTKVLFEYANYENFNKELSAKFESAYRNLSQELYEPLNPAQSNINPNENNNSVNFLTKIENISTKPNLNHLFINCEARPYVKIFQSFMILDEIKGLDIDFEIKHKLFSATFDTTLLDYYNTLCENHNIITAYLKECPILNEICSYTLNIIDSEKTKYRKLIKEKGKNFLYFDLCIKNNNYDSELINHLFALFCLTDNPSIEINILKNIFNYLDSEINTIIVCCGKLHADVIQKFLTNHFTKKYEYATKQSIANYYTEKLGLSNVFYPSIGIKTFEQLLFNTSTFKSDQNLLNVYQKNFALLMLLTAINSITNTINI